MFNIVITGANSGIGKELSKLLSAHHNIISIAREELDLDNVNDVVNYNFPHCDFLINCAGHDINGKLPFIDHQVKDIVRILNTNLLSLILLTHKALERNINCKIISITSTNNNRYWPNDLAYSLSKKSVQSFYSMLKVDYPDVRLLEVCVGLTRTNFNANRYKEDIGRFCDLYSSNNSLTPQEVANTIVNNMFNDNIKIIEVSP